MKAEVSEQAMRRCLSLHLLVFVCLVSILVRGQYNSITHAPIPTRLGWAWAFAMGPFALLLLDGSRMLGLLALVFHGFALGIFFQLRRFNLARWCSLAIWLPWFWFGAEAVERMGGR